MARVLSRAGIDARLKDDKTIFDFGRTIPTYSWQRRTTAFVDADFGRGWQLIAMPSDTETLSTDDAGNYVITAMLLDQMGVSRRGNVKSDVDVPKGPSPLQFSMIWIESLSNS